MEAIVSPHHTGAESLPVRWLSGGFVTPINKIGPIILVPAVLGAWMGILHNVEGTFLAGALRPFVAILLLAMAFMIWLCFRVQRVGTAGTELVVSNYLREERIPFEQVEAVESVWWNYRRMVRIRLRSRSSFGQTFYYIPKWAAFKCLWVAPEKELREMLASQRRSEPSWPYSA